MTSALTAVPVDRRRRSAAVAAAFAAVLLVAGILPWVMATDSVIRFLTVFVLVAALLAGFVAFGLIRSIKVAPPQQRRLAPEGGCGGNCQCGSRPSADC